MRQAANNELVAIIELTSQTAYIQLNDYQFITDDLHDFRARTLSLDSDSALPLIKELKDSLSKANYSPVWPFFYLFIAYIYFTLNDLHAARIYAQDAVRKFTNDDWNLALARWFLAIIFSEEGYINDAKEQLDFSLKTFKKIIDHTPNDDVGWRIKEDCNLLIAHVKLANERMLNGNTRLLESPRRDQKERFPSEEHLFSPVSPSEHVRTPPDNVDDLRKASRKPDQPTGQKPEQQGSHIGGSGNDKGPNGGGNNHNGEGRNSENSSSKSEAPSMNLHINIPIDIRSTDYTDQTSTQHMHTLQELNTNQDLFIVDSNPVNLKEPLTLQPNEHTNHDHTDEEANLPMKVSEPSFLLTPGLPIFGKVSAGPDGHVAWNPPNYLASTVESSFVRIEGAEYEVRAQKNGDHQISITYRDFLTSIIPNRTGGKVYGWLKVIGNSMNNAIPNAIEHNDYALIYQSNNLIHGKIVIVAYSSPESGEIRLLIKRLIKKSEDQTENWFLHSESLDKDPDTGYDYADLEMDDCYKVIGEVIAIAKPRNKAS